MNKQELLERLENYRHSDDPWTAKGLFDSILTAFRTKDELLKEAVYWLNTWGDENGIDNQTRDGCEDLIERIRKEIGDEK